jgi:peptidoglycan/LPS O-acetylase OafA/YrhL
MLGCALALLLAQPKVHRFVFRNFPKETPIVCGFPILLLVLNSRDVPSLAIYALIAFAIASTLVVEEGLAHKWLNFGPLTWIGRISFSLYVWQQLFMIRPPGHSGIPAPFNLICALIAAALSFYFIEQPLRKKRIWATAFPFLRPRYSSVGE